MSSEMDRVAGAPWVGRSRRDPEHAVVPAHRESGRRDVEKD